MENKELEQRRIPLTGIKLKENLDKNKEVVREAIEDHMFIMPAYLKFFHFFPTIKTYFKEKVKSKSTKKFK